MAGQSQEPFVPGLELSGIFYEEAVAPILARRFAGMAYAAARLDSGSDVLGYDTPRSTDHGWGPRLLLFLSGADYERYQEQIVAVLSDELPRQIRGYSTHFSSPDINIGYGWMEEAPAGPISHGVSVWTVRSFFEEYLNVNPENELSAVDWLLLPEQRLRTIRSGRVFHEGLRTLEQARQR